MLEALLLGFGSDCTDWFGNVILDKGWEETEAEMLRTKRLNVSRTFSDGSLFTNLLWLEIKRYWLKKATKAEDTLYDICVQLSFLSTLEGWWG